MIPKTYKGNKTDFSYFVNMALEDRLPWKTFTMLLNDVAPTLNETREIISLLLKELESLHLAFQEKHDELMKYQENNETESLAIDTLDYDSLPRSEPIDGATQSNEVQEEESSEGKEVIEEVEIVEDEEYDEDRSQDTNQDTKVYDAQSAGPVKN